MVFSASMFDGPHLIYIFASLLATVLIIFLALKFIKKQKHKDTFLKFWAFATVFLHLLPLWTKFLSGEDPIANDNMLFPIFFCNLSMYLLVVTAFWGDKSSKGFKYFAIVTAYSGILGALISLFYPEYYFEDGVMLKLGVMKSLLSHSTMLIGCLYILLGNYFKISLKENTLIFTGGMVVFLLIGILVNAIFRWAGLDGPNAMYLQHPPIEGVPFLNTFTIGVAMIGIVTLTSYLLPKLLNKQEKKALVVVEAEQ